VLALLLLRQKGKKSIHINQQEAQECHAGCGLPSITTNFLISIQYLTCFVSGKQSEAK